MRMTMIWIEGIDIAQWYISVSVQACCLWKLSPFCWCRGQGLQKDRKVPQWPPEGF